MSVRAIPSACEQCLERRKETASHSPRASGLVATTNPESGGRTPRNRVELPKRGRNCSATAGGWGWPPTAKPAIEVITDPAASNPAIKVITDSAEAPTPTAAPERKPAIEVITDSERELAASAPAEREAKPGRSPSASACLAHRDAIEIGLSRGRNAMAIWQDLVDTCGFAAGYQSVRRFVRKLEADSSPEARVVIDTSPGEDYGESRVMVREPSPVSRALAGSVPGGRRLSITPAVTGNVIPLPVQSRERHSRCFRIGSPVTISNTIERHHSNSVSTRSQAVCCGCSTRAK